MIDTGIESASVWPVEVCHMGFLIALGHNMARPGERNNMEVLRCIIRPIGSQVSQLV